MEDCDSECHKNAKRRRKDGKKYNLKYKEKRKRSRERDGKNWDRCMFWIEKKHRFCCMVRSGTSTFCGEHRNQKERIPCPLDPRHTIFPDDLERHKKRCPAFTRFEALKRKPYCRVDCNAGPPTGSLIPTIEKRRCDDLNTFTTWLESKFAICRTYLFAESRFREIASRLEIFLRVPKVGMIVESHSSADTSKTHTNDITNDHDCERAHTTITTTTDRKSEHMYKKYSAERHQIQHQNILNRMRARGLLATRHSTRSTRRLFIEFGAGRGGLTWAVHNATKIEKSTDRSQTRYLLIDRDSIRKKTERYLEATHPSPSDVPNAVAERLKIDIRHLWLPGVASVANSDEAVVISKHLCGVATDLSLRSVCQLVQERRKTTAHRTATNAGTAAVRESRTCQIGGIAIALCCHGLCSWREYVGRTFFQSVLKFDAAGSDFESLRVASSWMVGYRSRSFHPDISESERSRRVAVGAACKRLIDIGRVLFIMEKMGLNATLEPYCDRSTTPENIALLAWVGKGDTGARIE